MREFSRFLCSFLFSSLQQILIGDSTAVEVLGLTRLHKVKSKKSFLFHGFSLPMGGSVKNNKRRKEIEVLIKGVECSFF